MPSLGIAIAKRTGERRLLSEEEYLALDRASEARWEFFGIRSDPITGVPNSDDLKRFGFEPDGATVIEGDLREVSPGIFRRIEQR